MAAVLHYMVDYAATGTDVVCRAVGYDLLARHLTAGAAELGYMRPLEGVR